MIELEKKLLLSKEEYKRLVAYFGKGKSATKQVNYYYDTDNLRMDQQNITCRLRWKNGIWQGIRKKHYLDSDISEETTAEVYNGVCDNTFTREGLTLQGEMVTYRMILFKNDVCEVVLDKNTYLGYTDYEVELEYAQGYEQHMWDVLRSLAEVLLPVSSPIPTFQLFGRLQSKKSKSRRFFDRMKEKGNVLCSLYSVKS